MRRNILCWLLGASLFSLAGTAEGLSDRELNRIARRVDKAVTEGNLEGSRQLFAQLLDATSPGDERRQMALYGTVMLQMATATSGRNDQMVRDLLSEATAHFPRHPKKTELEAARRWLVEIDLVEADLETKRRELETVAKAFEDDRKELEGAAGDQREDLESKIRHLRAQLTECRHELEKKQAEVDKKEEALQKLKDTILGGQG